MVFSDAFLFDDFLNYLNSEKKVSKHTFIAYQNDLKQCFNYSKISFEINSISEIDYFHIKSWLAHLIQEKLDSKSVNRKLSALKSFYKYHLKHKNLNKNPTLKVISPKQSKKTPVFIDQKNINTIFEEDFTQAHYLVLFFYHTGIRLNELINIKKSDIDLNLSLLKILGKRNKERIIPFSFELKTAIKELLNFHPESLYLFNTDKGSKLYPNYVYRKVKNLLNHHTSISKKSPHVLRHTYATHLLNQGAEINAIKELLGHSNLSATQIYTQNSVERLKKIHLQAHPKS